MRRLLAMAAFAATLVLVGCGDDDKTSGDEEVTATSEPDSDAGEEAGGPGCEDPNNDFLEAEDPEVQAVIDTAEELESRISEDPTPTELEAAVADARTEFEGAQAVDRSGLCANDVADLDFNTDRLEQMSNHLG